MDKEYILEILNLSKNLKSDIIYINNNIIYGCDIRFNYLKEMNCNIKGDLCFEYNKLNKFIKEYDNYTINHNILDSDEGYIDLNNMYFKINITNLIHSLQTKLTESFHVHTCEKIREDIQFNNLLQMKSRDGYGLYKIDKSHILTIFKGLLPINKKDNVKLEIYDNLIDHEIFIAKFIISKSKNIIITQYISYLKMR